MYEKILVPVDGSEPSSKGLSEAVQLAGKLGSKLYVLHIVNEFVLNYSYSETPYATDVVNTLREQGNAVLATALREVKQQPGTVETILVETIGGAAAPIILQQARELSIDLIVMGTHGRRGMQRLALGSDAEEVVRQSGIPVLLVRGATPRAERAAPDDDVVKVERTMV